MGSSLLKELERRILLQDGAMGTQIQGYNLTKADYGGHEGCNEYLIITKPSIIREIYISYLKAGSDIVQTNTFGASRPKLEEYGLGDMVYEINYKAAALALDIAKEFSSANKPRFVLGSIGPTGFLPSSSDPELGNISFDELAVIFEEQATALIEGGVSGLLIETTQDILELKAIVYAIKNVLRQKAISLPIVAQITLDTNAKMLLGTDIAAALTTIEALLVDVIGINCSTGPLHMRDSVQYLCDNTALKVSCLPNAGLPINKGGIASYPLSALDMQSEMRDFTSEFGINIIGGCCGTTPLHIEKLAALDLGLKKRDIVQTERFISSSIGSISLKQEPRPLFIGERLNSQGSRLVKRLLLEEDYDGLLKIAQDQVNFGAHVLDICVALTERSDESNMIAKLVKKLSCLIEAPLMFDSTDPVVIESALKCYPGSPIINSINLESGEDDRLKKMLELCRDYGTAMVALTIDEKGMAVTMERKLEIAKRLYSIYQDASLNPNSLLIDVLTFTLATGENEWAESAKETLKGISTIKKNLSGVSSVLGLSNVSFGLKLPARRVLNSVFLHHALNEGLDAVIINPQHVITYPDIPLKERSLAEALIFNKSQNALIDLITHFEQLDKKQQNSSEAKPTSTRLPIEEIIHSSIVGRKKEGIEALIDEALDKHDAVSVLNRILLPAMKEVGNMFASGELILPFVLQSAEVMKKAVSYLENFLEKDESSMKGSLLLATVYGDVHDIGKNLVKTILSNNGYRVHDLGKQVPVSVIIEKAKELKVDVIGLSALLVSTSKQMALCVKELAKRGDSYPVIIGGAAINKNYSMQISNVDAAKEKEGSSFNEANLYSGAVFYAKDAFEGLDIMDKLTSSGKKQELLLDNKKDVIEFSTQVSSPKIKQASSIKRRSKIVPSTDIPTPPFFGYRVVGPLEIDMDEVFARLSLSELYRLSWGGRGISRSKYDSLVKEEFSPMLSSLKAEVLGGAYLEPSIIYAYFPCDSTYDKLNIYSPSDHDELIEEFSFPRQQSAPFLSITDYFVDKDKEEGKKDLIAFQVVSLGDKITMINDELNAKEEYKKAFYLHGLAVQAAEALTLYSHERILSELNLDKVRGKRYSFGYPACPSLEDQKKIMELMPVEQALKVSLTEAFLLVPEQSTSSFILHHKDATYFRV